MRHLPCLIFLSALQLLGTQALADQAYIKEVEGLIDSLPSKDSSRMALSLKLADAYYDDSLKLTTANMGTPTALAKVDARKALALYEGALTGFNGLFSKPRGDLRSKVLFQLARLYSDEGNSAAAQANWRLLVEEDSPAEIKRESVLRLAEVLEQKHDAQSLVTAKNYYLQALTLCSGVDVCSYAHYRLAWVDRNQGKFDEALEEMQKSLWDSKGQVREEALRDFLAFLVERPGDGHDALAKIEDLGNKVHRPQLIPDLAHGFFSVGNRVAGTYVLEHANKLRPDMKNTVSLLEEYYGFRDWTKFRAALDDAIALRANLEKAKDASYKSDVETEKILRRLTVQLDGERTTDPAHAEDFKNTVMFYLTMYSDGPQRPKMIDGWLVAETNPDAKMSQLKTWIAEENSAGRKPFELHLRQILASEAQKASKFDLVATQMAAIEKLSTDDKSKREAAYNRAYALYKENKLNEALPLFKDLAKVNSVPDTWAVQSQHLALDILGQQKNYAEILSQARSWTQDPRFSSWIARDPQHAQDLKDMKTIAQNAEFQGAATQGDTLAALNTFKDYCDRGLETPKSCENARVLAFKLKKEDVFIAMLKKLGRKDELITEFEVSGQFGDAADGLRQKLSPQKSSYKDYLKVALLYELNGDFKNQKEVLKTLAGIAASKKNFGDDEDLIYATLNDAGLLDAAALKLPWKKEHHDRLLANLEDTGRGTAETHKILVASCENLGPAWDRTVLALLKKQDDEQKKILFTGRQSKRKFEQRLAALKKLNTTADCYLQGATSSLRVVIATLLARSQDGMAADIKNSPIPAGMDPQVVENLKKSLDQMAAPFLVKAKTFEDLAQSELEKVADPVEKLALKQKLSRGDEISESLLSELATKSNRVGKTAVHKTVTDQALVSGRHELQQNPNEPRPLEKLKAYYEAAGQPRLAAYFQGRLNQVAELKTSKTEK